MAVLVLKSTPGIKRDGTKFDGDFYTDGQWVRFQRGLPRKIGGYRSVDTELDDTSRGFTNFTSQSKVICHSGSYEKLERFFIDENYNASILSDRTPATLVVDADNAWMFDYIYDSSTSLNSIVAHVSPNGACTCNNDGGQIFLGDVDGTSILTEVALPSGANASGGIVSLHPYLFYYGTAGIVGWSVPGDPTELDDTANGSGIARVWSQKIIKGLPVRSGSGSTPSGIFWAENAVIRASFTGGATVFDFDIVATNTSIMSQNAVIDYDGVFFWAGVDRFLMFNGVVKEVPNTMNINWFFDSITPENRAKVFTFSVPKFGEIWWCYPKDDATECDHAVIYNVRENSWYDTEIPERTAGGFNNGLRVPLLAGTDNKPWVHEVGTNKIDGQSLEPITSFFETADLSALVQGADSGLRISKIEPDFVQSGDMTLQIKGRANARAPEVEGPLYTFPDEPNAPYEELVVLKEQRREIRVRFSSDTVNGDYQMGQIIGHIESADKTTL